jgi:hypothetical protein
LTADFGFVIFSPHLATGYKAFASIASSYRRF